MRRVLECFAGGLLLMAASSNALGNSKTSAIDAYCNRLRADFASSSPFVFSGPDPWIQMDEVPASMPDTALAFIYAAGADVRWVFVRITDPDNGWSEDIDYFYRDDGSLAKRVRHLQSVPANIALDVTTYYADGRVLKEKSRHHALARGKTDSSQFSDPDAPTFWSVDDLPFPAIEDLWKRLA
jgi:hypothetical protein